MLVLVPYLHGARLAVTEIAFVYMHARETGSQAKAGPGTGSPSTTTSDHILPMEDNRAAGQKDRLNPRRRDFGTA